MVKLEGNIAGNWSNEIFQGADGKESLIDLIIPENFNGKLIVFVHGYMGFKDWGCWPMVEQFFVENGYAFCKYNISHNGCSVDSPTDFVDLESFGKNTYSKEKKDLECAMKWAEEKVSGLESMVLIGHSRGGGVALLSANSHPKLRGIATWAAISNIEKRFPKGNELAKWKKEGVRFQKNGRTKQELPLYYGQYEDYLMNNEQLDIRDAVMEMQLPLYFIHGEDDTSVKIDEGRNLSIWAGQSLVSIQGTAHTFGSSHPWNAPELPEFLKKVCKLTLEFFQNKT